MATLTLRDESLRGTVDRAFELVDLDETITVRELIAYQEVRDLEVRQAKAKLETVNFQGVVTPGETEKALNESGVRGSKSPEIAGRRNTNKPVTRLRRMRF